MTHLRRQTRSARLSSTPVTPWPVSTPTTRRPRSPRLREAQELITAAIDEAMAAAVVEGETLRSAGALAGLSENAVGPRLARTRTLAAYQSEEGRVTAAGVERARYDVEQGRHQPLAPGAPTPAPMRFRPRRPGTGPTT